MTLEEYLRYAVKSGYPLSQKWITDVFNVVISDNYDSDYLKVVDGKHYLFYEGEFVPYKTNQRGAITDLTTSVKMLKGDLRNLNEDVTTTAGRVVMNYILLVFPFNDKIPYINAMFNPADLIKKYMNKGLKLEDGKRGAITVNEYHAFINAVNYIDGIAKYISLSATKKLITPPDNIIKLKKEVNDKFVKEYGADFQKDTVVFSKYDKELSKIDNDWMKNDPSYNKILTSKKVKTSRKKLFLLLGSAGGLGNGVVNIKDALQEGVELDEDKLVAIFNNARHGSFSRGKETQQGGTFSKISQRATSDVMIIGGDCGSKEFLKITVTKSNAGVLVSMYMKDKNTLKKLKDNDVKKLIGKEIEVRSPMYCKMEDDLCSTCCGESLKEYEKGVQLLALAIGGSLLKASLAVFHATDLQTVELDTEIFA